MEGSLLSQGIDLMLIGMGTVFVFLTLLVFATKAMSAVAMRYTPAPEPSGVPSQTLNNDQEVVAAIAGAIALHRKKDTL